MMIDRYTALKIFRLTRSDVSWRDYRQLRNMVTDAIKRKKNSFFKYNIGTKSSEEMWRNLKFFIGVSQRKKSCDVVRKRWAVDEINQHFNDIIP